MESATELRHEILYNSERRDNATMGVYRTMIGIVARRGFRRSWMKDPVIRIAAREAKKQMF